MEEKCCGLDLSLKKDRHGEGEDEEKANDLLGEIIGF